MRRRGRRFSAVVGGVVGLLLAVGGAAAKSVMLYDFETDVQGWENEVDPATGSSAPAELSRGRARSGTSSLAFDFHFGKGARILHCRVKEGFQKDMSDERFQGFSAWVFIPSGLPNWEIKMFVRSGPTWAWGEGKTLKGLQPGWHRVDIGRDKIQYPGMIQDLGVEIMNFFEDIETTIYIDQVETLISDVP